MNKTFQDFSLEDWKYLLSLLEDIQENGPQEEMFGICRNIAMLWSESRSHMIDSSDMLGVVFISLGYEDEYTPISYPVGNKWRNGENGLERNRLLLKTIWKIKEYLGLPNYDIYAEDE